MSVVADPKTEIKAGIAAVHEFLLASQREPAMFVNGKYDIRPINAAAAELVAKVKSVAGDQYAVALKHIFSGGSQAESGDVQASFLPNGESVVIVTAPNSLRHLNR